MLFQPSNVSTQDSANINNAQQNDIILFEKLIVMNTVNNNKISKETFNFINSYQQNKKINVQVTLNQFNPFLAFLKNFASNSSNTNLIEQSLKLYNSSQFYLLLKTGQYLIQKDKKQYLLFTQHHITYLKNKNNKELFGYKYKHNKYIYIGYFNIHNNNLQYQYQGTGIFTQFIQQNKFIYSFINGKWKDGQIIDGIKQLYNKYKTNQDGKCKLYEKISQYRGSFRNTKYNGYGILKTYKNNEEKVEEGIFQFGKFVTKQLKQKKKDSQFAGYDNIVK